MSMFSDILRTIRHYYPHLFAEEALWSPTAEDLTLEIVDVTIPRQAGVAIQAGLGRPGDLSGGGREDGDWWAPELDV
jgi:hypothetical protein